MPEDAAVASDADGEPSTDNSDESTTPKANSGPNESAESPDNNTTPEGKNADNSTEGNSEALVDEISDSLSDEGFGIFHGREFVSIREDGQLAPNSTVSEQYLAEKKAVILAYNEDSNEIAIVPLEEDYERTDVYSLQRTKDRVSISASGFLKDNEIEPDQTIRYSPEWDGDFGGDQVPGGLRIDLNQEGEVSPSSQDPTDDESE